MEKEIQMNDANLDLNKLAKLVAREIKDRRKYATSMRQQSRSERDESQQNNYISRQAKPLRRGAS